MIMIGLTGSLATGKSTISRLLSSPPYNLPIIDADLLAREVVAPGTWGYKRIIAHFGEEILLPPSNISSSSEAKAGPAKKAATSRTRDIDRAALGRRVFGDSDEKRRERAVLNGIVHPLVRLAMLRDVLWYYILGYWAIILDVPLLFESGLDVFCSVVLVVCIRDRRVQLQRLRDRDKGLSEREARERLGSQMSVEEKVGRTRARGEGRGKVVWNDGGRGELEGEVRRVVREVEGEAGGWFWRVWVWGSPLGALGVGAWEVWRGWRGRGMWEVREGKGR